MKGKILDFNIQNSSGVISGDDGNRYNFSSSEWKSDKSPTANQIVDFAIDGENATGIYVENSSAGINTDAMKEKFSDISNSDTIRNISKNGVQNLLGFIISLLLAFSLFFKIVDFGFLGSASLIEGVLGKLLFIVILGAAFIYYTGIKKEVIKIIVGVSGALILFKFFDIASVFSQLNGRINILELFPFGAYITFILTIAYLIIGFKSKFKN
jgi:hypothetical protein